MNRKVDEFRQENAQLKVKNKDLEEENNDLQNGLKEIHAAIKEQGALCENLFILLFLYHLSVIPEGKG